MYEESTVTEKLTGVIKESSITEILEKVKSDMCDKYCKYPEIVKNQDCRHMSVYLHLLLYDQCAVLYTVSLPSQ